MNQTSHPTKIIVIGAGLAGLTAAYRLDQQGEDVELYEARERIGGRVHTIFQEESHEELGGKFLSDGGEATHIIALMHEFGLEVEEFFLDQPRVYIYAGKAHDYDELFKDFPAVDKDLILNLHSLEQEYPSLGLILDRFFEGYPVLRRLYEIRMSCLEGSDTKDLSSYYVHSFFRAFSADQMIFRAHSKNESMPLFLTTIAGGNHQLINALAKKLEGKIYTGSPLRKMTRSQSGHLRLHFDQDKVIEAEKVILALPCSCLKEVEVEKGLIPEDQWRAIEILQYGTNAKILLPMRGYSSSLPFFSITNEAITWFNKDRSIMTLYYGGSDGVFDSHSSLGVESKINASAAALKALFPGLTVREDEDVLPVGISWCKEEFSRGSYSNWGVGQHEIFNRQITVGGEPVREVFRPIDEKIFFAGEHTALDYPATMEGAVESGERVVRAMTALQRR